MASQIHKLPLPGTPCFCTILLLICSLLCFSGGSIQNYFEPYTPSSPFKQTKGLLFLSNSSSTGGMVSGSRGALGSYMQTNHQVFSLSDNGWFFILQPIFLWKYCYDGTGLHEESFNFEFNMNIYLPKNQKKANSSLVFTIQPSLDDYLGYPVSFLPNGASNHTSSTVASSHVSTQVSTVYGTASDPRNMSFVQIDIDSPSNSSVGSKSNYTVWIDYNHVQHRRSVSVDTVIHGTSSTATADAILKFKDIVMPSTASFGFYSSKEQLLQHDAWSLTAERLPYYYSFRLLESQGKTKRNGSIILSSVLASAAAVAITTAIAYIYFNSKYRKWKKEQDKLSKTMQRHYYRNVITTDS